MPPPVAEPPLLSATHSGGALFMARYWAAMSELGGGDLMKAVLTDAPFDEPGWVFERKFDGIRCLAVKQAGEVRLLSRNDLDLRERFPTIAAAVAALNADDFALDGEVVAVRGGFAGLAH